MKRRFVAMAAGAACFLLASCSENTKTQEHAASSSSQAQTPPTAPENEPVSVEQPADQGQKLTGQVSALSAEASDLGAQMTDLGLMIQFNTDVLFDFDKADIKPDAQADLEKLAKVVQEYSKSKVTIVGHSDAKGDAAYNQALSVRRAQAIADWLQRYGARSAHQFKVEGRGETKPIAPNTKPDGSDNPEGRQQNRRVEIVIS